MAGLFGARRPAFTDIQIPVDAPAQIPVAAAPPRRGLFGRLGSAVTPRNLMVVGATLQELGGRRGALGGQIETMQAAEAANAAAIQQAQERASNEKYRQQALELQRQRAQPQPEVQHDSRSGTFWIPDPSAPEGYRILGRDPNWQPPRPLVQFGGMPDDGYDYQEE